MLLISLPGDFSVSRLSGLVDHVVRIIAILLGAFIAAKIFNKSIPRIRIQIVESMKRHGRADIELEKRAATLSGLFRKTVVVVIWIVAIIMALKEAGFDVGPILAGAGARTRPARSRNRCRITTPTAGPAAARKNALPVSSIGAPCCAIRPGLASRAP